MSLLLEILTLGIKFKILDMPDKTLPDMVASFLTLNTTQLFTLLQSQWSSFCSLNTLSLFPLQGFGSSISQLSCMINHPPSQWLNTINLYVWVCLCVSSAGQLWLCRDQLCFRLQVG